jgi:TRAP-type mannitol/chloroaromatic compound transport system permease small subunit
MLMMVVLVSSICYEVFSRRLLDSPTLWAFDVSSMTNGAIFVLSLAEVMRRRQHICIDFLSSRFPAGVIRLRDLIFFGMVLSPILVIISMTAWQTAFEAWETGRVDRVSPWAPKLWPYLSAIALGLTALTLETLKTGLCALTSIVSGSKTGQPT